MYDDQKLKGQIKDFMDTTSQVLHYIVKAITRVARGWRRLCIEELHNLYASTNIIRVIMSRGMRWVGHGEMRNAYKILDRKPEEKRPLRRLRYRWEKIAEALSSKPLVSYRITAQCHNSEDHDVHLHCHENLKSCTKFSSVILLLSLVHNQTNCTTQMDPAAGTSVL
jgi:hypothetical protein